MGVGHQLSGSGGDLVTWDTFALDHLGIQVGTFSVTALELSHDVALATALDSYQVFLQPTSSVSASFYPSNRTPTGFTVNFSFGVNASFAYLVVADSFMSFAALQVMNNPV